MKIKTILLAAVATIACLGCDATQCREELILDARNRVKVSDDSNDFRLAPEKLNWAPTETAVIVCDMWDKHWCKGATRRVAELAPHINDFVALARKKGAFIIHAPSSTVGHYDGHPARKRAQSVVKAASFPPDISKWSRWMDADAISDSGGEIWSLLAQRGIKNIIIVGVHTNMCVLGRPFGLRNMARYEKNVVLVRDLTDTMYNPRMWPFVDHFTGTDLIVEHIEKFVCPTILSSTLTGRAPFRFKEDKRSRIVFVVAENEYDADRTLPEFARELQSKHSVSCEFALGVAKSNDAKERNDISNMGLLADADLAIVYVRRRALPKEQMKHLRNYIKSGKPLIGLRTASHAFSIRNEKPEPGYADWPEFDHDVLGGNYQGHHGNKAGNAPRTYVWVEPKMKFHPILAGVPGGEFHVRSWLYKTSPLTATTTVLMTGRVDDRKPHEPVAWTNTHSGGGRVFYTSLGHPGDFQMPAFRRMLTNAVFWTLDKPMPVRK